MKCKNCGGIMLENARFCTSCGTDQARETSSLIGYSDKINDPRIAASLKKMNNSGMLVTLILALAAVIGFSVAGYLELGGFELPWAFFFGLALGSLLIVMMLFQWAKSKKDTSWDGVVVKKTYKKASYADQESGNYSPRYKVYIQKSDGKIKKISSTEDLYNYYQIGDHVRHHAGTLGHLFEKYDKSKDSVIYCIVCSSKNQINNDICHRCKSPLMK